MLARVALPAKIHRELYYEIPVELGRHVTPGRRVIVPLRGRMVAGYVTALGGDFDGPVKPIIDVAGGSVPIDRDVYRLCKWMSEYYAAPLGEVLRCASTAEAGRARYRAVGDRSDLSGRRGDVYGMLSKKPKTLASLTRACGRHLLLATLLDLLEEGAIEALAGRSAATPQAAPRPDSLPSLTVEQQAAAAAILESFGSFAPILLHGVTASGKTRVYIEAVLEALRRGRRALYLVPEIAMTFVLERELPAAISFCTIHSHLGPAEKARRFEEIRAGRYALVVGTRSALFAPIPDLGVIIVDEEQDAAYKQEERVRYHAREAAVMRAKFADIPVVLGSATPSIETYHLAVTGRYRLVEMKNRLADRPLPKATTIDMRRRASDILSDELKQAIHDRLSRGEQVIVLMNRRGYAPHLICLACGAVLRCRNCQVSMVFHRERDGYLCHYCGEERTQPQACPECSDTRMALIGTGTEKALESLQSAFAGYPIERLDSDVATSPSRARKILEGFGSGQIRILVGTQMLAKGHHFPRVTLVGILTMDHLLGMPDFRASERVFQLIAQVSGRSGRGDQPGEVLIQTRYPAHPALLLGCSQDYLAFYQYEVAYRESLRYPPFSSLALLTCQHADKVRAARLARALAGHFPAGRDVEVLGPSLAPLPRIRGQWRLQILLRGERKAMRDTLRRGLAAAQQDAVLSRALTVDVDPLNLL